MVESAHICAKTPISDAAFDEIESHYLYVFIPSLCIKGNVIYINLCNLDNGKQLIQSLGIEAQLRMTMFLVEMDGASGKKMGRFFKVSPNHLKTSDPGEFNHQFDL